MKRVLFALLEGVQSDLNYGELSMEVFNLINEPMGEPTKVDILVADFIVKRYKLDNDESRLTESSDAEQLVRNATEIVSIEVENCQYDKDDFIMYLIETFAPTIESFEAMEFISFFDLVNENYQFYINTTYLRRLVNESINRNYGDCHVYICELDFTTINGEYSYTEKTKVEVLGYQTEIASNVQRLANRYLSEDLGFHDDGSGIFFNSSEEVSMRFFNYTKLNNLF